MKWGEYSSDVQFILQRSDQKLTQPPATSTATTTNTTTSVTSQQHVLRQQQIKETTSAAQIIKLTSKHNNLSTLNSMQKELMATTNSATDKNKENRKNLYLRQVFHKIVSTRCFLQCYIWLRELTRSFLWLLINNFFKQFKHERHTL